MSPILQNLQHITNVKELIYLWVKAETVILGRMKLYNRMDSFHIWDKRVPRKKNRIWQIQRTWVHRQWSPAVSTVTQTCVSTQHCHNLIHMSIANCTARVMWPTGAPLASITVSKLICYVYCWLIHWYNKLGYTLCRSSIHQFNSVCDMAVSC